MLRRRGFLALLGLVCLSPSVPAAESKAIESILTAETVGFVHIRVADVCNAQGLAFYRKVLAQVGVEELAKFNSKFVPTPASVDTLTIILPSIDNKPELPNGNPLKKSALWVVTTKDPIDRVDLMRALGPNGRTKSYRSTDYLFDEETWAGIILLDGKTLVYASEDAIVQMIDQRLDAKGDSPLAAFFRTESSGKSAVVLAVSPQTLAKPEVLRDVPEKLLPLFKAKTIAANLAITGGTKITITGDFTGNAQATEGEAATKTLIGMGRDMLAKEIEKNQREMADAQKKPTTTLQNLPEQFGHLALLAVLKHLDGTLKSLPIKLNGSQVAVDANLDEVLPDSSTTAVGVMMMGFAFSRSGSYATAPAVKDGDLPYEIKNGFKQIHDALEKYYKEKGAYPPAAIYDGSGKPLLSWRVLILPYMEGVYYPQDQFERGQPSAKVPPQKTYAELYKQFKLDEPWDSLHNKKLLTHFPNAYRIPYSYYMPRSHLKTGMLGFNGSGAMFDGRKGITKDQVKDGLANTTLIVSVENDDHITFWTKPSDVPFAADKPLPNIGRKYGGGLYAMLADGTPLSLPKKFVDESLKSTATIAGGETVALPKPPEDPSKKFVVPPPPPKLMMKFDFEKVVDPSLELRLPSEVELLVSYPEKIAPAPREVETLTVMPRVLNGEVPDSTSVIRGAIRDNGTYDDPLNTGERPRSRFDPLIQSLDPLKLIEGRLLYDPVDDLDFRGWELEYLRKFTGPEKLTVMPRAK